MPKVPLIFIMGVSGSGKTTLGVKLASLLGYEFLDADDFHSEHAVAMMRSGKPLTENERGPWMASITKTLVEKMDDKKPIVMAISGLKHDHRLMLRAIHDNALMLVLEVPKPVLIERLSSRQGHFFPLALLDSQLSTQQKVDNEPYLFWLDGRLPVKELVTQCQRKIDEIS